MDKENGESTEGGNSSSKLSNPPDSSALLDAASLFGAYWPRSDASTPSAASLFAAAGGSYGLHGSLPFGMLPPSSGRSVPSYPPSSSAAAYNNTLSVAASQAASLGIPAASAAWWSMASHLAAQDYLARLQASGLNFPSLANPGDLSYSSLGLPQLSSHHNKSSKNTKTSSSSLHNRSGGSKSKNSASALSLQAGAKLDGRLEPSIKTSSPMQYSKPSSKLTSSSSSSSHQKNSSGLTIQPSSKPSTSTNSSSHSSNKLSKSSSLDKCDLSYLKQQQQHHHHQQQQQQHHHHHHQQQQQQPLSLKSSSMRMSPSTSSIFTSPLSLASNSDSKSQCSTHTTQSLMNSSIVSGLPSSILSDPNSILGGVRLPPDTEIIKYTSSIVGPKIPGTTNRGRKKTISLDPPSVSVHPTHSSTGMLIERSTKRPKLEDPQDFSKATSDRVEVIKLPATNGSLNVPNYGGNDSSGDAPLNLSLKPSTTSASNHSSSLNSLSNMSANIGVDRISRRKPGPKPRRVIQSPSNLPPGAPSASLVQLFATADSPRPPSRSDDSEGGMSSTPMPTHNHKEGRPRNLGRGVSKPKKNTVASLLAQSRALDPNAPMNQQMSILKSNILAAQQYIAESGSDDLKHFEKLRGTLSDSSNLEQSTDSDNLTDSYQTDSEMEQDSSGAPNAKKRKQFDETDLRVPIDRGWKRETIIRGLTKNGGIKGDVSYSAPDSNNKFKQMSDVTQYLDYQKSAELSRENFTFSCRVILGDYLQPAPSNIATEGEFIRLSEDDVKRRLEELRQSTRTNLAVEQRIEVARRQQAARAAARLDREQARLAREMEKSERQEAARRDREARSQQLMEARRKRQEEMEKHKHEEQQRKQQERELKRQQAAIIKEQMYIQEISKQREMLYTVELERERRRQHMSLVKALESRRKLEERERKKQQIFLEKQASKERRMEQRRVELEILLELRKPCEDLELTQKPLPTYNRIPGLKLSGEAFSDTLMVFEFLHNFGETLGFDMESLPTLDSLQQALLCSENSLEAEEELLSVMTHLLVCAIEDPGIPNPARHTTILGQSLRQADITHANLSEILRIYLYANATGEVKALTGVHFERDREKRVADHHQSGGEMQQTQSGKNAAYYELLHDNTTWQMSDKLKDKPFLSLSPTDKAAILAFLCNELLQNKAVIRQIEGSLETVAHLKKERWLLDTKIRKFRMMHNRKIRTEAVEKAQAKMDGEAEIAIDSPSLHKDDLLDDDEDMSENESVGTQPEEEEDNKLSGEELGKKLEKLLKTSETQLHSLNLSAQQLRATCYGQDRFWRRYWSLPTAGGIFVEGMESAQPEVLQEQKNADNVSSLGINSIEDIKRIIHDVDSINDASADKEVSKIVGGNGENVEGNGDVNNEHRKTPNRIVENGEVAVEENGQTTTSNEHEKTDDKKLDDENAEENSSVKDDETLAKTDGEDIEDQIPSKLVQKPTAIANLHLFERLGECMENQNGNGESNIKTEVKPEVKEELKMEILNELKADIKHEMKREIETDDDKPSMDGEYKWFSVISKDGASCESIHFTAGNRWDNGTGVCSRENMTELKIPVFPPPNCQNNYLSIHCDSPGPLQMTAEESVQLEYIKLNGLPKPCERKIVPQEMRYGWWRIHDIDQLRNVLDNLHIRGARERELKRTFQQTMQSMYERAGNLYIEEGQAEATELHLYETEATMMECGAPEPDQANDWNPRVAQRVDLSLLEQVEALEDKVANASMQVKGWKVPSRDGPDVNVAMAVELGKERLASLEAAIERRYLKPPLGVSTGDPNLAAIAQEASGGTVPPMPIPSPDDIPKGLTVWREAVGRSATSAQLAMCLYTLEASIAWDKSIMKANCQFCHSGDNEDKLLLCDGCDKGYHTYCFRPKMDNIPDGDWYCHECMNKATGERNCIVCGKKLSTSKLVLCDLCPRAYHQECLQPPLTKVPRGKWYCPTCHSKQPKKRNSVRKSNSKHPKDAENPEYPPASPAPSHSSVTTNEDSAAQLLVVAGQPVTTNCAPLSAESVAIPASVPVPTLPIVVPGVPSVSGPTTPQAPPPPPPPRKEKVSKKLVKELAPCKALLEDLECHDDAWPFLLPVNTKQFPTYKKIIKSPMDLSTIKKRLQDLQYKSREDFCSDVRQIFNNCETFNEDDSPVGKAGHCMRQFFEARWNELCPPSAKS